MQEQRKEEQKHWEASNRNRCFLKRIHVEVTIYIPKVDLRSEERWGEQDMAEQDDQTTQGK